MPRCPNCGQETKRTTDWACQWCGYPLTSRAYKAIDKSYRELKEERELAEREEAGEEITPVPEDEPATPPPQVRRREPFTPPPPKVERPQPPPKVEPPPKAEPQPTIAPPPRREQIPQPAAETQPVVTPPPPPVLQPPEVSMKREPPPAAAPPPVREEAPQRAPEPPPQPIVVTPPPGAQPDLELSAEELLGYFSVNETAVDEKLRNRTIKVSGIVDKVKIDDTRATYHLFLTSPKDRGFRDIECRFDRAYINELSRYNPGDNATVQGQYSGYTINVILRKCTLVR